MGPSKNLIKIANLALTQGHGVKSVFNTDLHSTQLASPKTDAIITGLSSFKPKEELALGEYAKDNGIPWYVIADTHGNFGRPAAKGLVDNATVIVASPGEMQDALDFGYGDALYLGGPPEWDDFWNIPTANIDLSKKLTILVGGIKLPEINHTLLKETVKAMNALGHDWQMIYKPHPNEWENNTGETVEDILDGVTVVETNDRLINLIPAVDLTILTSGTTAVIQAAYLRKPTVYFEDQMVRDRMVEQTGTEGWFPTDAGVSALATPENMAEVIQEMLSPEEVEKLKLQQERIYPKTETDKKPEENILEYIMNQL